MPRKTRGSMKQQKKRIAANRSKALRTPDVSKPKVKVKPGQRVSKAAIKRATAKADKGLNVKRGAAEKRMRPERVKQREADRGGRDARGRMTDAQTRKPSVKVRAKAGAKKAGRVLGKVAARFAGPLAVGAAAAPVIKAAGKLKGKTQPVGRGQLKVRKQRKAEVSKAPLKNVGKVKAPKIASSKQFAAGNKATVKKSAPAKKPAAKKAGGKKVLSAFETAFATARKGGRKEFSFGGKRFSTKLKK